VVGDVFDDGVVVEEGDDATLVSSTTEPPVAAGANVEMGRDLYMNVDVVEEVTQESSNERESPLVRRVTHSMTGDDGADDERDPLFFLLRVALLLMGMSISSPPS
jgi:hypothetical protein